MTWRRPKYSAWTRGVFAEAISVVGDAKLIFLGGIGAEDERATSFPISILHPNDFVGQCLYAWDKINRTLHRQGGSLASITQLTIYVTDVRNKVGYATCAQQVFKGIPVPAATLVGVTSLAWPDMLLELQVTAAVPRS